LFGWEELQPESVAKAFDVALHLGTLIAVVAYFRHDLVVYVRDGVRLVLTRRPAQHGRGADGVAARAVGRSGRPRVGALFESVGRRASRHPAASSPSR
jgi:undecaprenyl-diphosphatase